MFPSPFLPALKMIYWRLTGWSHRQMENKWCAILFAIKWKTVQRLQRFWQKEFFLRAAMLFCMNSGIANELIGKAV